MTVLVISWDLKEDIKVLKEMIMELNDTKLLKKRFSDKYFNGLLAESDGDIESCYAWLKEVWESNLTNLNSLLQNIANETKDNELVQRRLKAVGYTPEE